MGRDRVNFSYSDFPTDDIIALNGEYNPQLPTGGVYATRSNSRLFSTRSPALESRDLRDRMAKDLREVAEKYNHPLTVEKEQRTKTVNSTNFRVTLAPENHAVVIRGQFNPQFPTKASDIGPFVKEQGYAPEQVNDLDALEDVYQGVISEYHDFQDALSL